VTQVRVRIAACGVFRSALENMGICDRFPEMKIDYLQPYLHHYPIELRKRLEEVIRRAHGLGQKVICVYGQCFPDIDVFLQERGATRPSGGHCYEMLLGHQVYETIIDEEPGTYFLEKELLMNFSEYCVKPLELDDPQMRKWFFGRYKTILYIHQPGDPDLRDQASKIAQFLNLHLQVKEADYTDLKLKVEKDIQKSIPVSNEE
jgi:hypothetical protein